MAHFAKLGVNGKVLSVEVVADADCQVQTEQKWNQLVLIS